MTPASAVLSRLEGLIADRDAGMRSDYKSAAAAEVALWHFMGDNSALLLAALREVVAYREVDAADWHAATVPFEHLEVVRRRQADATTKYRACRESFDRAAGGG